MGSSIWNDWQQRKAYLVIAFLLFFVEVAIAMYVTYYWIRSFVGDILAVWLVYCGLRFLFGWSIRNSIICALCIAFGLEFLQLLKLDILKDLPLVLKIALGSQFDYWDLVAYSIGGLSIVLIETIMKRKEPSI
ncbi:DUF2809 domain-containing protein [Flavobacteriaceae bacterium TK19130]|nr:DUF2809 domain-containing protein [Thermobacterium salinum]